jgi:NhaP-type Na+/H+ or K+/H+ antiporter
MSFLGWMTLVGFVLLSMALASAYLRRIPASSAMVYLALGVAIGPLGAGWIERDMLADARWLERLTEVVVIISLFISGLRLRLPLRDRGWRAAYLLAGPAMLLSIVGVAAVAHYALGLPPAVAVLLGAVLAPTDPVLAGEVAVADASDQDRLRYSLTGEAGLNDGAAFPFVIFAMLLAEHGGQLGLWVGTWALSRVVWAVPAGLAIGFGLGYAVGLLATWLRTRTRDNAAPSDFVALALIALAYVTAEALGAWGFLAVFAAGLGMRRTEMTTVRENPPPARLELAAPQAQPPGVTPAEALVERRLSPRALAHPAVASGALVSEVLSFGGALERMLEVVVVILVGALVSTHWDAAGLIVAAALFLVIRPAAAALLLIGTPTDARQRLLIGWFGIRGIGTVYYLTYAISHGFAQRDAETAADIALTVIAVSIVVHGASATPLLARYEQYLRRREARSHRPARND